MIRLISQFSHKIGVVLTPLYFIVVAVMATLAIVLAGTRILYQMQAQSSPEIGDLVGITSGIVVLLEICILALCEIGTVGKLVAAATPFKTR